MKKGRSLFVQQGNALIYLLDELVDPLPHGLSFGSGILRLRVPGHGSSGALQLDLLLQAFDLFILVAYCPAQGVQLLLQQVVLPLHGLIAAQQAIQVGL